LCSSPLRLETWTSCCVQSVAPGSAQTCTAAHSLLASLHLGASRAAQLAAASRPLAVPLREERRARFRQSVAPGSAQSCTAAHSLLASLHLGASRATQLAAASRPLAVPLRDERRARFSSKLHGDPQPPRVAPPRSVACCAARRCVAALGRPAAYIASRLVQLKAARRPTAASRLSTSERRALRTSQHRRGIWTSRYVQSVAPSSAQSCTSAHSRLASLHLGASRLVQLATASWHLDVLLRAEHRAWFSSKLHSGPQPPRVTPPRSVACCAARRCVAALDLPAACRASRLVQLKAARRPTAASRHSTSEHRVLRCSPLRRGPWPSSCVKYVARSSAQSCTSAHSRLASLHLIASRLAQLAAASRPLAVPLRA